MANTLFRNDSVLMSTATHINTAFLLTPERDRGYREPCNYTHRDLQAVSFDYGKSISQDASDDTLASINSKMERGVFCRQARSCRQYTYFTCTSINRLSSIIGSSWLARKTRYGPSQFRRRITQAASRTRDFESDFNLTSKP